MVTRSFARSSAFDGSAASAMSMSSCQFLRIVRVSWSVGRVASVILGVYSGAQRLSSGLFAPPRAVLDQFVSLVGYRLRERVPALYHFSKGTKFLAGDVNGFNVRRGVVIAAMGEGPLHFSPCFTKSRQDGFRVFQKVQGRARVERNGRERAGRHRSVLGGFWWLLTFFQQFTAVHSGCQAVFQSFFFFLHSSKVTSGGPKNILIERTL